MATRSESDELGSVTLPADALYGVETARALAHLAFSRHRLRDYPAYLAALAAVKRAAARANQRAGVLAPAVAGAIDAAGDAVMRGAHAEQFPVDLLGGGGSIGVNMNLNEVLAALATRQLGSTAAVQPRRDVNASQSTADVCHSAARLAVRAAAVDCLRAVDAAATTLQAHAQRWAAVPTLARTCLQDAMPTTVDVLFAGHAGGLRRRAAALRESLAPLDQVVLGATVIGDGQGAPPAYRTAVVPALAELVGRPLAAHPHPADALQHGDDLAAVSAALVLLAQALGKLAQDLRLLASGPRGGLGELRLPHVQSGSSFFSGKSNPVLPESVIQCVCQVLGCDRAVQAAAERAELHLQVFDAVAVVNALDALSMLGVVVERFERLCLRGLAVNEARCRELAS
ncbi:MAG: lyase family protein [Deltaproteobacteria bacterium]|nr:lyase family protein [Deltaproteobacteria bacterium]